MKTIAIYTKENSQYYGYIAGIDVFTTGWDTLEECKKDIAEETKDANISEKDITRDIKKYFGDLSNYAEVMRDVVEIEVLEI